MKLGFVLTFCFAIVASGIVPSVVVRADEIVCHDSKQLREALRSVENGQNIKIAPGEYVGGHHLKGIKGLTIEALDPSQPPLFRGGTTAWQFSSCEKLTLRNLKVTGQTGNGINLDDSGQIDRLIPDVTLENIEVSDVGPTGNHDGIKCSGLQKLTIRNCTLSGWGGSAIDFVGCHDSLITGCRFTGKEGFSTHSAIQLKGGTSKIIVEKCHFEEAGERPINVGGSTGLTYFRPQGAIYEASEILVRENIMEGSMCAAAFVGVDKAEFINNTILYPTKWIFRILQETREPGFVPCRDVLIKDNRIIFRRAQVQSEINIGSGTSPETFRFERNQWFAEDQPTQSKPRLPTEESNGIYGVDPRR